MSRLLVSQEWEILLDDFPADEIQICLAPLLAVNSIKYDDENGDEQTLATSEYSVDVVSEPGWIVVGENGWPSTYEGVNAVRIRVQVGYAPSGSPADYTENVPERAKIAIKMLLAHWYERREAVAPDQMHPVAMAAHALLDQLRIYK